MQPPDYQKFPIKNLAHLRSELDRLDLAVPLSEDLSVLSSPLQVGRLTLPNRFCTQPMEGCDAQADGAPGPLTLRRYTRYAEGGFGLIWIEATAVAPDARSRAGQLCLCKETLPSFKQFVTAIQQTSTARWGRTIPVVLQLAHAPHPDPDIDLDSVCAAFAAAAKLASNAGFDGVDIKTCHGDLLDLIVRGGFRKADSGETPEQRLRPVVDLFRDIHARRPGLLLCSRMGIRYDREGAGLQEALQLAEGLTAAGVSMLNVSPDDPDEEMQAADPDTEWREVGRKIELTRAIQQAFPETVVVAGNVSGFRQFVPQVASGIINGGGAGIIGLGRAALAYPDLPGELRERGQLTPEKTCMLCGCCSALIGQGVPTGCVIRDPEIYGAEYRHQRRFDLDHLRREAGRCLDCEAAPCIAACPAGIDVPGFIKAFEKDDIPRSYTTLKERNVLPEMCSHLCPGGLLCEGACIQKTLTGIPVPIRDIQYVVSWLAREEIPMGIETPVDANGRHIAIVGAGPAGLSAAAGLAAYGHRVTVYERGQRLGGTPEAAIPGSRYPGAQAEITARFKAARDGGRITVQYGRELGVDLTLTELREGHDAVLLATGLWEEQSLCALRPEGVVDALQFLCDAKQGRYPSVPEGVALLSGGDCAMDAAREARRLGARDIYIIFEGTRAEMHWHMEESWFASDGVHLMTLTQPVDYHSDSDGVLTALRCRRMALSTGTGRDASKRTPVAGSEYEIPVGLVIEAMGLRIGVRVQQALEGLTFTAGGLVQTFEPTPFATNIEQVYVAGALINGGASVARCVAEGMQAAEAIHESFRI